MAEKIVNKWTINGDDLLENGQHFHFPNIH